MTIDYTSPEAFAASIRMRLRAIEPATPLVIVEGKTDRAALSRVLHRDVVIVPAANKEKVLGARRLLKHDALERCTFIIDCDGDINADWRSEAGVIVTEFRDIDADTSLAMGGIHTVIAEHLAAHYDTGESLSRESQRLYSFVLAATTLTGLVTDTARLLGMPVRIPFVLPNGQPRRRRIRADDLPQFAEWARARKFPTDISVVITAASSVLGWEKSGVEAINAQSAIGAQKHCRSHDATDCRQCMPRRFANGHELAATLSAALTSLYNDSVDERAVLREARLSVTEAAFETWRVRKRLAERGQSTGRMYLRR